MCNLRMCGRPCLSLDGVTWPRLLPMSVYNMLGAVLCLDPQAWLVGGSQAKQTGHLAKRSLPLR